MDNKLNIHTIVAPELNNLNYGDSISKQFDNINENFHILGNHDFIKGQQGDGLYIENIKLIKEFDESKYSELTEEDKYQKQLAQTGYELYQSLKTSIINWASTKISDNIDVTQYPLETLGGKYNWDDIINGDFVVPVIVSENKNTNERVFICSAGIVTFFDARFSANALEEFQFTDSYNEGMVDTTSFLNFIKTGNNWECNVNTNFPRLKYKDNTFYWVVNDDDTLIKATGIKGEKGNPGEMYICYAKPISKDFTGIDVSITSFLEAISSDEDVNLYEVENYLNNPKSSEFIPRWSGTVPDGLTTGSPILVYHVTEQGYLGFFLSYAIVATENNSNGQTKCFVYTCYNPDTNITNINYMENTNEFFKSLGSDINISGGIGIPSRGVFLLMDNYKKSNDSKGQTAIKDTHIGDRYAHMIYNDKCILNITPVNDYEWEENPTKLNNNDLSNGNYLKLNVDYDTNINGDETVSGYISTEKYVKTPVIYALGKAIDDSDGTGRHGIVFGVDNVDEYEDDLHDHGNHNACIYSNDGDDLRYYASSHEFAGNLSASNINASGNITLNNKLMVIAGGAEIVGPGTVIKNTLGTSKFVINSQGKTKIEGVPIEITGNTTITNNVIQGDGLIIKAGESGDGTPSNVTKGGTGLKVYGGETSKTTHCLRGNSIEATGNIIVDAGSITVNSGKVTAKNGFFQDSDETLKDFHNDIQVDFEKLSLIPKKQFTWKTDKEKHMEIGTSAQEVRKLYPELVSENENGILSVSYDKLSIVALKAIDELYKKNQELERRIKELENKL